MVKVVNTQKIIKALKPVCKLNNLKLSGNETERIFKTLFKCEFHYILITSKVCFN
jgi:hypothetical protein